MSPQDKFKEALAARGKEHFYACTDREGAPLGYVKATSVEAAMDKAVEEYGDRFGRCERYDGVL